MSKKTLFAHLAVLGANLIYGVNYVVAKGIMPEYLEPRAIIFLRISGAAIIFWLVSLFFPKERVETKDIIMLAFISFFGIITFSLTIYITYYFKYQFTNNFVCDFFKY